MYMYSNQCSLRKNWISNLNVLILIFNVDFLLMIGISVSVYLSSRLKSGLSESEMTLVVSERGETGDMELSIPLPPRWPGLLRELLLPANPKRAREELLPTNALGRGRTCILYPEIIQTCKWLIWWLQLYCYKTHFSFTHNLIKIRSLFRSEILIGIVTIRISEQNMIWF